MRFARAWVGEGLVVEGDAALFRKVLERLAGLGGEAPPCVKTIAEALEKADVLRVSAYVDEKLGHYTVAAISRDVKAEVWVTKNGVWARAWAEAGGARVEVECGEACAYALARALAARLARLLGRSTATALL